MKISNWMLAAGSAAILLGAVATRAQRGAPAAGPQAPGRAQAGRGGRGAPALPPIKSPEVSADGRVTFRVRAPNARTVAVAGQNAPDGPGVAGPMTETSDGVWSFTTEPLPPDVYNYSFNIDGASVPDTANPGPRFTHYGEGVGISTVEVPGTPPNPWDVGAVPRGSITHAFYLSKAVGVERDYYVYTPPGYDPKRRDPYPVIYLLHGLTEEASAWFTVGKANVIGDNYIAQGKMKPVIMVAPLGYGTTEDISRLYNDKPLQLLHLARYTDTLLNEIMPRVEPEFNISRQQKDHAIAGLSMGGAQTMSIGLGHPDRFAYVGGISPALVMLDTDMAKAYPAVDSKMNSQYKLVYFSCGTEDGLINGSIALKAYLDGKGVKSEFVRMPGRHVWQVFRRSFAAFALRLFQ
jgi:enterochelin esterase family protein